jgi:hypothetical protein
VKSKKKIRVVQFSPSEMFCESCTHCSIVASSAPASNNTCFPLPMMKTVELIGVVLSYLRLAEAFAARSLGMPKRILLATSGSHIATLPNTTLQVSSDRFALKVLLVDFPARPWPAVIVTLKNRTLSPVVQRFIQHIRDFTRPMRAKGPQGGDEQTYGLGCHARSFEPCCKRAKCPFWGQTEKNSA